MLHRRLLYALALLFDDLHAGAVELNRSQLLGEPATEQIETLARLVLWLPPVYWGDSLTHEEVRAVRAYCKDSLQQIEAFRSGPRPLAACRPKGRRARVPR